MSVIYILILVSLVVALVFLGAFLWAVKDGQYEDAVSPSVRILYDEQTTPTSSDTREEQPTENQHQPQPTEYGT